MKLRDIPESTVSQFGTIGTERKKMGLEISAKTFKLMSSTIYKYKIRAIVRELSTNAIDGHQLAGNPNPFDVHLPTKLDPFFRIRDYGTGLSPEMIDDVFTVYFKSTKTDSNDQIGSMGLGSKSPLCYVEAFTVESVQNGTKSTYTIYLENGEPYCQMLQSIASDEPNGLCITIPVTESDINEWELEAKRVYSAFTGLRPNFVGVCKPEFKYLDLPEDGSKHNKYKSNHVQAGVYARMGSILYPIDKELFDKTLFSCYYDSNTVEVFEFDIGELDFSPSREELSLDKITKAKILERMKQKSDIIKKLLVNEFSKAVTVRDKLRVYNKLTFPVQNYVSNSPEFYLEIKDRKPLSMANIATEIGTLPDVALHGYWSNAHSASDCVYQNLKNNRHTRSRETSRRQGIGRLLSLDSKKLYLFDMGSDEAHIKKNPFRATLRGHSIMHDINHRYIDVSAFGFSGDLEEIKNNKHIGEIIRIGHFDDSEIVYLKSEDMDNEREAYRNEIKRFRSIPRDSDRTEKRSKTPTAYLYELSEGRLTATEMFLTRKEFMNVCPSIPIMRLMRVDDYENRSESCPLIPSILIKNIDCCMKETGHNQVMVVRNNLWDLDGDHEDFSDIVANEFVRVMREIKQVNYKTFDLTFRRELTFLFDRINISPVGYTPSHMYDFVQVVSNAMRSNVSSAAVSRAYAKHKKMSDISKQRYGDFYKKFKEMNPMLDFITDLSGHYYTIDRSVREVKGFREQFIKSIKWK